MCKHCCLAGKTLQQRIAKQKAPVGPKLQK